MALWLFLEDLLVHPITLIYLKTIAAKLVLNSTSSSLVVRIAVEPLMLLCIWLVTTTGLESIEYFTWMGFTTGYSIWCLFLYIRIFWRHERIVQASHLDFYITQQKEPWIKLLLSGFGLSCCTRYFGPRFEVKNVLHLLEGHSSYVPSKPKFVFWTATKVLWWDLMLQLTTLPTEPIQDIISFSSQSIPFLTCLKGLSSEQIITRSTSVLRSSIIAYCLLQATCDIVSLVSVCLGLSNIEAYRPPVESWLESYPVRLFWG